MAVISRREHVLLIYSNKCFELRRKVNIRRRWKMGASSYARRVCWMRVSLGDNKVALESPQSDEDGKLVLCKGSPAPDAAKRSTENMPLYKEADKYCQREALPYRLGNWIGKSKARVGYELSSARIFYEYIPIGSAANIAKRIEAHERSLMEKLCLLFGNGNE